ncbi:hypothetical protein M2475_000556 [Breznakia sp. PF5-3]|uniref:hypothetical protein n=1 Tax=unclassified Breznakia TaxID=2623764 RepID=UPI002406C900|nr:MULTISPECIES: hypothetical protein [unclassified Breznakia]MDF9824198.1 hypothetical protein [Breznakia sp. PM6-1]MDF9834996.1 hypothetical protein [Breznakia sp. PF5-3]MDF9837241.1 hypothetical protein [Breznakia sp. PFB2-8]MDF9859231.1 hypothetical protein [Breznakia sp. PH5-24]
MKYPTVRIDKIPRGFKHCEIAVLVAFSFHGEDAYIDGEEKEAKAAYAKFIKKEVVELMDSFMTIFRPVNFPYKDKFIVALKDNANEYQVKEILNKLLIEIDHFTEHKFKVEAHILNGMLMENDDPTIFKVKKVGLPLEDSEEYAKSIFKPEGKMDLKELSYITPYAEFKVTKWKKQAE